MEVEQMRTTIYEPFTTIRRLQDEMNRAFGGAAMAPDDSSTSAVSAWVPAVDVHEHDDRFVITADVPGVDPNAIEVTMEKGVLTISGERKGEKTEESGASARRVERIYGSFFRRFTLPDSADEEAIEAHSSNGVLEIAIPKKQQVQPKKIKVNG
jgi:HSP20 family protein